MSGRPPGLPGPLISHPAFWTRLSKLYARLKEACHAIIHRRLERTASGGITPYGDKRRRLRTISVREVDALVIASYGLAEDVIAGRIDRRRCNAIAWPLDELQGITKWLSGRGGGGSDPERTLLILPRRQAPAESPPQDRGRTGPSPAHVHACANLNLDHGPTIGGHPPTCTGGERAERIEQGAGS